MQKNKRKVLVGFVLTGLLFMGVLVPLAADETLYVKIKETALRDKPSNLGKVLGTLTYTTAVVVSEKNASWAKVTVNGKNGWVALQALVSQGVKKSEGTDTGASGNEVSLAGKGFSKEVEAQYKADSKLDFTWIDKMEKLPPDESGVDAFAAAGPQGGK